MENTNANSVNQLKFASTKNSKVTVFIKGFPIDAKSDEIVNFCEQAGLLHNFKLRTAEKQAHLLAFVDCASKRDAKRLIKFCQNSKFQAHKLTAVAHDDQNASRFESRVAHIYNLPKIYEEIETLRTDLLNHTILKDFKDAVVEIRCGNKTPIEHAFIEFVDDETCTLFINHQFFVLEFHTVKIGQSFLPPQRLLKNDAPNNVKYNKVINIIKDVPKNIKCSDIKNAMPAHTNIEAILIDQSDPHLNQIAIKFQSPEETDFFINSFQQININGTNHEVVRCELHKLNNLKPFHDEKCTVYIKTKDEITTPKLQGILGLKLTPKYTTISGRKHNYALLEFSKLSDSQRALQHLNLSKHKPFIIRAEQSTIPIVDVEKHQKFKKQTATEQSEKLSDDCVFNDLIVSTLDDKASNEDAFIVSENNMRKRRKTDTDLKSIL